MPQLDELLARVDHCSTQAHELSTQFQELREQIRQAIDIAQRDPEMSLIRSRKVLEYIVVDIYDDALKPKRAGTQPLEGLVQALVKEGQFPNRLAAYADMVRGLGNVGAHGRDKGVSSQDVLNSLGSLLPIVEWFFEHRKPPDAANAALPPAPVASEPIPQTAAHPQPAEKLRPAPPPLSSSGQRSAGVTTPNSAQPSVDRAAWPAQHSRAPAPANSPVASPSVVRALQNPLPPTAPVLAASANDSRRAARRLWAIAAGAVVLLAFGVWSFAHRGSPHDLITNSIGMKLKLIPAGEFMMGSPDNEKDSSPAEHPAHRVQITKPFYLGIYSVTRGQFRQFVDATNYKTDAEKDVRGGVGYTRDSKDPSDQKPEFNWRNPGFEQSDEHPVVNVSWNDAVAFCRWLSQRDGRTYRLPTEAEWEYACRAGTTTTYFFGDDPRDLVKYANVADSTLADSHKLDALISKHAKLADGADGYVFTSPVGSFQPNAFGLYDMQGNAEQRCSDFYSEDYYQSSPLTDPQGPIAGSLRVIRGSYWNSLPVHCRSAHRRGNDPVLRGFNIGFRVLVSP